MPFSKPSDRVVFADEKLEKAFNSLSEDSPLKKSILKAIDKIKENAFYGERIPQKQIPKEYIKKYNIDNLLWVSLANAWRLVYSVVGGKIEILSVIIDYYSHKDYERKFKY